jgi:hypothetical protein
MSLQLKFLSGPFKGKTLSFDQEEVIFGRGDDCDVILKDSKISGEHCGIFYEDGEYFLEDFESTNGTYVDTTKVEGEVVLNNGETIFIGTSRIIVKFTEKKSKSVQNNNYSDNYDEFDDLDEDTNVKKLDRKRGFKKILDPEFYIDAKEKFVDLETNKKIGMLLTVVAFLAVIVLLSSGEKKQKVYSPKNYPDYSEKIYPIDEAIGRLWGFYGGSRFVDFSHPKKLKLSFHHNQKKKIIVKTKITGIDYIDELEIRINDHQIMFAPITGSSKQNVKFSIPLEYIKLGTENVLEFLNKRNMENKENKKWAVFIEDVKYKLLHGANVEQATIEYKLALKLYKQRKVSRGNRFKSLETFGRAIDFMELLTVKPHFYNDCIEKRKLIKSELNKLFIDSKYGVYRAMKFGNVKAAKEHLYHIIEEIPDETDGRYNFAIDTLNKIK